MNLNSIKYLILVFVLFPSCQSTTENNENNVPELEFVAAVRQKGPVAYRDPIGAISPDGKLFVYSDFRRIVVQPIGGGASYEIPKQGSFVRYLKWTPDSKSLVSYELGSKTDYWYLYDVEDGSAEVLWPDSEMFEANTTDEEIETVRLDKSKFRELTWSPDGQTVAGIAWQTGKRQLWTWNVDGSNGRIVAEESFLESIAWNPANNAIGGIVKKDESRVIDLDLQNEGEGDILEVDAYGDIAFSPDGKSIYYSRAAEGRNTVDLWKRNLADGKEQKLTSFSKDTYAPVVADDSSVVFKLKDYKPFIAMAPGDGGASTPINTFQSEIAYWHPEGKQISFTYGTWRRIMDDAKYPDIAQHLGVVDVSNTLPKNEPEETIRSSYSEDQGMCWSPNLKFIAFHTHADGTDDIWVMPVGEEAKGKPLSTGGDETGWPRWSPDGKWIVYNTAGPVGYRVSDLFIIGIDQETGEMTEKQREIIPPGLENGSFNDAWWTADSKHLVVEYKVDESTKEIHKIPIDGGAGELIYRWESDQLYSGISLSHDEQWVAFIAADDTNRFQVFKVSMDGEKVVQITFDDTDKAHPAFSPTENRIAFTSFKYEAIFWRINGG